MKALVLFSGGLDSMIAIRLLTAQGIDVTAIHIDIGFSGDEKKAEILRRRANEAGAELKIIDIRNEYLRDVLFAPKYGYGKHFNPCIDCHGYMFKTALAMLQSEGASFIITGEVLGQRPMSQRAQALAQVGGLSGDEEGLILRPLCAKLLPPTTPEIKGWVDRSKLLAISGRDRKRQLALAKEFGFSEYETPGGGCLLTIESFANKIKDFIKFDPDMTSTDMQLLRIGRHLRLTNGTKMVIGRDENDNAKLLTLNNPKFTQIKFDGDIVGAVSFVDAKFNEADLEFAVRLALAYTRADKDTAVRAKVGGREICVKPFESKQAAQEFFVS